MDNPMRAWVVIALGVLLVLISLDWPGGASWLRVETGASTDVWCCGDPGRGLSAPPGNGVSVELPAGAHMTGLLPLVTLT